MSAQMFPRAPGWFWTDIRGWGVAFLMVTMLALSVAVCRGYHAEHAHQLIAKSAMMEVSRPVAGAGSGVG